jgi:chaperonin GroEL
MAEAIVKNLSFGQEAKSGVFKGIKKLTNAVSSTLGASGKCVMFEDSNGKPVITKDGVTVANSIILLDPVENMGATLLKEAARQTVKEAGDGTTTATVLARSILEEAYKVDDTERNIRNGINSGVKKVIEYLEKETTEVKNEMIDQVATISSNNDKELGEIIASAFKEVGKDGVVSMESAGDEITSYEIVDGATLDKGLTNFHFITEKDKGIAELNNPLVLLVETKLPNVRKIQNVLEYVIKNNKPLLVIADAEDQLVSALAMNKVKGNIQVNIIGAPNFGINRKQMFNDLALITGATVINEDLGDDIDLIEPEHLGTCLKSTTSDNETIIRFNKDNKEIDQVIVSLKEKIEKEKAPAMKIRLEKRLAFLNGKVGIIKVGANSEVELKEKNDRVEDAICATKAAIKEGIVPGGGIALLNASNKIESNSKGEQALLKAIQSPFNTIMHNAGFEKYDMPKVKGEGYNVVTGNMVNMIRSGIIDPLLVTKSALKNAASVATTILSTDCVINNLRVGDESNR